MCALPGIADFCLGPLPEMCLAVWALPVSPGIAGLPGLVDDALTRCCLQAYARTTRLRPGLYCTIMPRVLHYEEYNKGISKNLMQYSPKYDIIYL